MKNINCCAWAVVVSATASTAMLAANLAWAQGAPGLAFITDIKGDATVGSGKAAIMAEVGKGAFYFNDGSWFEGVFEDGLKKGKGTMIYKDGSKRAAEMIDGMARAIQ